MCVCVLYHEVHVLDLYRDCNHMYAVNNVNMAELFLISVHDL